jgi:selenocysteine lyase/cysteine desulfurase
MLNAAAMLDVSFAELRAREFSRLDAQDHVYLDYTGSALYAESQVRAHAELLRANIFGNPHSDHHGSRASTEVMDGARELLLRFLDVDSRTHDVIFTANTTAAIKLVAESYPFTPDTPFVLSVDNHNSINGIREYSRRAGAPVHYLPLDEELRLRDVKLPAERGLLAFPAQSNFSGVRHPLSLVQHAKSRGYDVLLDVASFVPTAALSLCECPADFVALSFYKLFGYPTGIGALVARRDALARLQRPWFAGGTVAYASVHADTHHLRARHEGFEDGTQNFLGIAALRCGFALLEGIGMQRISQHVASLAALFLRELNALPHIRVYGRTSASTARARCRIAARRSPSTYSMKTAWRSRTRSSKPQRRARTSPYAAAASAIPARRKSRSHSMPHAPHPVSRNSATTSPSTASPTASAQQSVQCVCR